MMKSSRVKTETRQEGCRPPFRGGLKDFLPAGILLLLYLPALPLSALLGPVSLPAGETLSFFFGWLPGWQGAEVSAATRSILAYVRLPRILVTLLTGSSLAAAGAVMQGLFRNPLASPDILGISAGGSLGALIMITLGWGGGLLVGPGAVAGCFLAALLIWKLGSRRGSTSLLFIILAGLAVSSFLNGLISLVLLFSREHDISRYLFWTMGGLSGRRWIHVLAAAPFLLTAQGLIWLGREDLDLFLLGEDYAHTSGLAVERKKQIFLLLSALLTGISVSISGTIGFIGLMVPHFVRLITGSRHRPLLPASALGGGLFLLFCDTLGRTAFPPYEIRAGIITSLLGGPFFLFLLLRRIRGGGA